MYFRFESLGAGTLRRSVWDHLSTITVHDLEIPSARLLPVCRLLALNLFPFTWLASGLTIPEQRAEKEFRLRRMIPFGARNLSRHRLLQIPNPVLVLQNWGRSAKHQVSFPCKCLNRRS